MPRTADGKVFRREEVNKEQQLRTENAGISDLDRLDRMVTKLLTQKVALTPEVMDEAVHPASSPIYWIAKWVDYSDKYGIGKLIR
jgi:hypothetical protein